MGSESVKVVVRCRPLNDRERALGSKMVMYMDMHRCQCFIEKPRAVDEPPKQFTFDGTYFIDQTTEQMYNEIAYPLVEVGLETSFFLLHVNRKPQSGDPGIIREAHWSLDTP